MYISIRHGIHTYIHIHIYAYRCTCSYTIRHCNIHILYILIPVVAWYPHRFAPLDCCRLVFGDSLQMKDMDSKKGGSKGGKKKKGDDADHFMFKGSKKTKY